MTDVLDVIKTEKRCVIRNSVGACDRNCMKCDLLLPTNDIIAAYDKVISTIQNLRMMVDSHKYGFLTDEDDLK